jgi:thiamine biosynthesis lipoprotein
MTSHQGGALSTGSGLSADDTLVGHAEVVMGTVVSFVVDPGPLGKREVSAALREACAELHRIDDFYSLWKPASAFSRFVRGELSIEELPAEATEVLEACESARRFTGGLFDPWSLPGGLDPSGYVKGWAAGRARDVLVGAGLRAGLVNAGGDIASFGGPGPGRCWRVGIRHPWRGDALACVIETNGALATSGSYERGRHLVDPRSGQASLEVVSATVVGPDPGLADAFATALAVGGARGASWLASLEDYGAYVIGLDGSEVVIGTVSIVDPSRLDPVS